MHSPLMHNNNVLINANVHFISLQVFDVGESRAMPMEFPELTSGFGGWRAFVLAAGLADAVSRSVTAPFDRLKIQLQVSFTVRCYFVNLFDFT